MKRGNSQKPAVHRWALELSSAKKPSCTLQVPLLYEMVLQRKIEEYGTLRSYLRHLLLRYHSHIGSGMLPYSSRTNTHYQEEGQEQVRFDFRPFAEDWLQLKLIARGSNVSACHAFVLLLMLDFMLRGRTLTGMHEQEQNKQTADSISAIYTLSRRTHATRAFLMGRERAD